MLAIAAVAAAAEGDVVVDDVAEVDVVDAAAAAAALAAVVFAVRDVAADAVVIVLLVSCYYLTFFSLEQFSGQLLLRECHSFVSSHLISEQWGVLRFHCCSYLDFCLSALLPLISFLLGYS